MTTAPNFDRLARPYRWLEYLTFGPLLQRMRLHHLKALVGTRNALVLGDGDGRFTCELFRSNSFVQVRAVDLSAAMLHELRQRCALYQERLITIQGDALLINLAESGSPDLIATHFFLDCFSQAQLESLIPSLADKLTPHGLWVISDFNIPENFARFPARLLVRLLYTAFRLLTGLKPTHLPDHRSALKKAGLHRIAVHHRLFGMLISELWCKRA